ncbi:MAG: Tubulin like [Acidobacteriota bacterium]|jgi:hypothetical protein|nr:Tubulin like [Acidobacteriota bacterium]
MPNSILVVGIGGAGRGVCNHLHYELSRMYGKPANARVSLLVIDGPQDDANYQLPGGYAISSAPGATEFFRPTQSPADVLRQVATGDIARDPARAVAKWLPRERAAQMTTGDIQPQQGFGGQRVPGHAYVFVDYSQLSQKIVSAYQAAQQLAANGNVIAFVVTSIAGGTGAGLYLDVLQILRKQLPGQNDLLISILPLSKTYNAVVSGTTQQQHLEAKNFAALRNLIRFMAGMDGKPTVTEYSEHVSVASPQLVSVPFLMDGSPNDCKVNDVPPNRGVVPAIADFLLSIAKDNKAATALMTPRFTDWAQIHNNSKSAYQKFSSFGSASLRYDYQDLLETFCYRITRELYDQMLTKRGPQLGEDQKLVTELLRSTDYTQMVLEPSNVDFTPPVPTSYSRAWRVLAGKVRVGKGKDPAFPYDPQKLQENVDLGMFFKRAPQDVEADVNRLSDSWKKQVKDWLERQKVRISTEFQSNLDGQARNIFYDPSGTPKSIATSPASLRIASDLVALTLSVTASFRKHVHEQYEAHFHMTSVNGRTDILSEAVARTMRAKEKMFRGGKAEQEVYVREAQRQLEVEMWKILMDGIQETADALAAVAQEFEQVVGQTAGGWVNALSIFQDQVDLHFQTEVERRKELSRLRLRRYFPKPGGFAEDALYEKYAYPVFQKIMASSNWLLTIDPGKADRYTIILQSPSAADYDAELSASRLKDVIGQKLIDRVSRYTWHQHTSFIAESLREVLRGITIWELVDLDYSEGYLKRGDVPPAEKNASSYSSKLVSELLRRSAVSIQLASGADNPKRFVFWRSGAAQTEASQSVVKEITARCADAAFASHDDFSHEIRVVSVLPSFSIRNWTHFAETQNVYLPFVDDPLNVLVDIYPNEQVANRLQKEIRVIDRTYNSCLDPRLANSFSDYDTFRYFSLCYALNLLTREDDATMGKPRRFVAKLAAGTVDLGEESDIGSVAWHLNTTHRLESGRLIRNDELHNWVRDLWRIEEKKYPDAASRAKFADHVEEKMAALDFGKQRDDGFYDETCRKELQLSMKATLKNFASMVRASV